MIIIRPNNEMITVEDIDILKKDRVSPVPGDYVKFLLRSNGGTPETNILLAGEYGKVRVDEFFGIKLKNRANDIVRYMQIYRGRIPDGFIPVASTGCGNIICLSLDKGEIYLWDHDFEIPEGDTPFQVGAHCMCPLTTGRNK
ncbi:MAG: SMI1/KNR4 family protein [Candidatus Omnitrophota bacterium]